LYIATPSTYILPHTSQGAIGMQSIKVQMDEIALASSQQSEMIVSIENGIKEISQVVQTNTASAKESANVSKELSDQAHTLNSLLSRFRIQ